MLHIPFYVQLLFPLIVSYPSFNHTTYFSINIIKYAMDYEIYIIDILLALSVVNVSTSLSRFNSDDNTCYPFSPKNLRSDFKLYCCNTITSIIF